MNTGLLAPRAMPQQQMGRLGQRAAAAGFGPGMGPKTAQQPMGNMQAFSSAFRQMPVQQYGQVGQKAFNAGFNPMLAQMPQGMPNLPPFMMPNLPFYGGV